MSDPILDYNAITITPKAPANTTTGAATTGTNTNTQNNQQQNNSSQNSGNETDIIDYLNKSNDAGYLL